MSFLVSLKKKTYSFLENIQLFDFASTLFFTYLFAALINKVINGYLMSILQVGKYTEGIVHEIIGYLCFNITTGFQEALPRACKDMLKKKEQEKILSLVLRVTFLSFIFTCLGSLVWFLPSIILNFLFPSKNYGYNLLPNLLGGTGFLNLRSFTLLLLQHLCKIPYTISTIVSKIYEISSQSFITKVSGSLSNFIFLVFIHRGFLDDFFFFKEIKESPVLILVGKSFKHLPMALISFSLLLFSKEFYELKKNLSAKTVLKPISRSIKRKDFAKQISDYHLYTFLLTLQYSVSKVCCSYVFKSLEGVTLISLLHLFQQITHVLQSSSKSLEPCTFIEDQEKKKQLYLKRIKIISVLGFLLSLYFYFTLDQKILGISEKGNHLQSHFTSFVI